MNDRADQVQDSQATGARRSGRDLVRATLGIVLLLGLLATIFVIIRPLLPAILWSSAIVVSTWPVLIGLDRRLGGRRALAAGLMTLILTVVMLLPFFLGVVGILNNTERIVEGIRSLSTTTLPPPPAWVGRIPLLGETLAETWRQTAAEGGEGLMARLTPYADRVIAWLLSQLGSVGKVVFHTAMTVLGVVFLYRHGERVGGHVRKFAARIAGPQGENAVRLAAQATRSVALGVLVTAIVQALLAGVGLVFAGVPSPGVLTLLMILTGLAQVGPMPVLIPAVAWLYWQGSIGWGTALLAWAAFVGVIDNVMRPFLIRLGADLPLMLVFVGVLGGLMAFGVVGLFIGPVVLAVGYRLMQNWAEGASLIDDPTAPAPAAPGTAKPRRPIRSSGSGSPDDG
jgi:predicted PurR-regulated permease PerM